MKNVISVIIPVYNSSPYIADCVESVLAQTYPHFEILLIDDGSEDNSKTVCQRLCARDCRIQLLKQPHKGVSAARNAGIKAAKGEYLFFVDSDDIIHPQLMEALYILMEKNSTAVATVKRYCVKDGIFPRLFSTEAEPAKNHLYIKNGDALDCRIFASSDTALFGIGGKMILRRAAKKVKFDETLTQGEDTLFMYQLLADGADVSALLHDWYYYRKHAGGATGLLSVEACQSKYTVECRICNEEIKKKRIGNAACWENAILSTLIQWYETGLQNRDKRLTAYAKKAADIERNKPIFSQIEQMKRIDFYLTFHCYPLHRVFPAFLYVRQKILRTWSMRWKLKWMYKKTKWLCQWLRWKTKWLCQWLKWKAKWLYQWLKWILKWGIPAVYKRFLKGIFLNGQKK